MPVSLLVIDVGTSSVRAAIMEADASLHDEQLRPFLPDSPEPGTVEFDARVLADTVLDVATAALAAHDGPVEAVGITNQRASTVVWDRATSEPIGPAIGWQDLRTIGMCLEQQANGFRFAPNVSATKIAYLLDTYDPDRSAGPVLRHGRLVGHLDPDRGRAATSSTRRNAAVTGVLRGDGSAWSPAPLESLRIPAGDAADGRRLERDHRPGDRAAGRAADRRARGRPAGVAARPGLRARRGRRRSRSGPAGCSTWCSARTAPRSRPGATGGTFPIITWRLGGTDTWGLEAIMLAAGTNVEWLRDDLGILDDRGGEPRRSREQCADTGGVVFVPALLGLGTPQWDFGARGTVLGLTRGTGRPELVRAVLEGVAQRGADLVEAAETDGGRAIEVLRVDGGMSRNPTFVQALADAAQKPVEVSPVKEATTLGAGFLAGLGRRHLARPRRARRDLEAAVALRAAGRASTATGGATRWTGPGRWIPELSTVDF